MKRIFFLLLFAFGLCSAAQAQQQVYIQFVSQIPCPETEAEITIVVKVLNTMPTTMVLNGVSTPFIFNVVTNEATLVVVLSLSDNDSYPLIVNASNGSITTLGVVVSAATFSTSATIALDFFTSCGPGDYLDLTIFGGVAPYSTTITDITTGNEVAFDQLMPGGYYETYTVDAVGCSSEAEFVLPTLHQGFVTLEACNGLVIYNGIPYPADQVNIVPAGLSLAGCDSTVYLYVTQISNLFFIQNLSEYCNEVKLDIPNLPSIYSINWMVGPEGGLIYSQSGTSMTGLPNGDYYAELTNSEGCVSTLFTYVQTNGFLEVAHTLSLCRDSIYTQVGSSLAVAPFSYEWTGVSPSSADASIGVVGTGNGLTSGYTITDVNGCAGSNYVFVEPVITGFSSGNFPNYNFDCEADVNLNEPDSAGVHPPISYQWTGPNGFTSNAFQLNLPENGNYVVVATDAVGCSVTGTFEQNLPDFKFYHCNDLLYVVIEGSGGPYEMSWYSIDGISQQGMSIPYSSAFYQSSYIFYNAWGWGNAECLDTLFATDVIEGCPALVTGNVFLDVNANCTAEAGEYAQTEIMVLIASATDSFYTLTNGSGNYTIALPEGNYIVSLPQVSALETPCNNNAWPVIAQNGEQQTIDLGLTPLVVCGLLDVTIASGLMRPCFQSFYTVEVCNEGTIQVEAAQVRITLDPNLTFLSSPQPYAVQADNSYLFELGNLNPYACAQFQIDVSVSCDATMGASVCTEALATPISECMPDLDGYIIDINGTCETDSVHFLIQNLDGPLSDVDYIIIEDQIILLQMPLDLNSLETQSVNVAKNGSTYWLGIVPNGSAIPDAVASAVVEGCDTDLNFSTGFVNQFVLNNNLNEFVNSATDCAILLQSYDPNDKVGMPLGYGPQHRILPNTEIDYKIRFQNTGNDTAFTVVLRDTLPSTLDIGSFKTGTGSHFHTTEVSESGIVTWTFPNIMLPDSNVNEAASHGFVTFKISPRTDVPLNTQILNSAAIFFDFNAPVITNTSMHTLGLNITVSTTDEKDAIECQVFPNPTSGLVFVSLTEPLENVSLELSNLLGQPITRQSMGSFGGTVNCSSLPAGIYILQVKVGQETLAVRKIVVQ